MSKLFTHEYWVNFVRLDHVCKYRWITTEMEKLIIQKGISLSLQSHNLTFYAIRSFGPLHFGGDFITFTHHRHTVYISWWLTLQGPLIKPVVQAKLLIGCTTVEESIILTQSWWYLKMGKLVLGRKNFSSVLLGCLSQLSWITLAKDKFNGKKVTQFLLILKCMGVHRKEMKTWKSCSGVYVPF